MDLSKLIPPWLWRRIPNGVQPVYTSFEAALASTDGYGHPGVIEVVAGKTRALRARLSSNQPLLVDRHMAQDALVLSRTWSGSPLKVLDIGGACGAKYFGMSRLWPQKIGSWKVIETPAMVELGRREFADDKLSFHPSAEEALSGLERIDLLIASGVLQYLPSPLRSLDAWLASGVSWVYLARTLLVTEGAEPIITRQVSRLTDHGPGPAPRGAREEKVSFPITLLPLATIHGQMEASWRKELGFVEDEDRAMWIGLRKISARSYGFLLRHAEQPGKTGT